MGRVHIQEGSKSLGQVVQFPRAVSTAEDDEKSHLGESVLEERIRAFKMIVFVAGCTFPIWISRL
jgi:hypothetical protein